MIPAGCHISLPARCTPVVTIELPSAFRTPLEAEMRQMWIDMLRWMSERVRPAPPPEVLPVRANKVVG